MEFLTVEEIAKLFYENHEEQCCNCRPWGELTSASGAWDREDLEPYEPPNFIRPAQKVWTAIYGEGG